MDSNRLVGFLMAMTGILDLVWARTLASRLTPATRVALSLFGAVFLALGGAMLLGFVKAV